MALTTLGRMAVITLMVAGLTAFVPNVAQAQEQAQAGYLEAYVEMLRSDVRAQKAALVAEAMQLSEAEASAFWPLFREYENELAKVGDDRVALLKDFADNYHVMTDQKAQELAERFFRWDEKRTALKKEYFGKMAKAVSPIRAAQFLQIDNKVNLLIDLQISARVPLVE